MSTATASTKVPAPMNAADSTTAAEMAQHLYAAGDCWRKLSPEGRAAINRAVVEARSTEFTATAAAAESLAHFTLEAAR